jgi:hypothetical protein
VALEGSRWWTRWFFVEGRREPSITIEDYLISPPVDGSQRQGFAAVSRLLKKSWDRLFADLSDQTDQSD